MKLTFYKGLAFLFLVLSVPALMVASLFLGQSEVSSALVNGTLAYAWLVSSLYISSKPKLLTKWLDLADLGRVQTSLMLASLPLIFNHQLTSSSDSLLALTGVWAMVAVGAMMIYGGLLALAQKVNSVSINPKLIRWAKHLNALAVAVTFAHAHVFASSTNLVFMSLLYLVTGLAFFAYVKKALVPTTSSATLVAKSSI